MVLAGPILRRVESKSINVWIALDEALALSLVLKDGETVVLGDSSELIFSIGSKLVVKLVSFTPKAALESGKVFTYDLKNGNNSILTALISDAETSIGYGKDKLPSFVLPATEQKDLVVAHGSCRKMHGDGPEALSSLDTLIKENLATPNKRIQQLFLTGDQLYADEIPAFGLVSIIKMAQSHISAVEKLTWNETKVIHRKQKKDANGKVILEDDKPVWEDGERVLSAASINPADAIPGLRSTLLIQYAKMTTGSGESHLLSFGEFCAGYLHAWHEDTWSTEFRNMTKTWLNKTAKSEDIWTTFKAESGFTKPNILAREYLSPFSLEERANFDKKEKDKDGKEIGLSAFEKLEERHQYSVSMELKEVADFLKQLPKVRRILANTPTYMIFDDHEVTDDWNISQKWKNDAYGNPLGKSIIRNALMAYTLFQDLGNVPDEYRKADSKKRKLADAIVAYAKNPMGDTTLIDNLLGLKDATTQAEVTWHYHVESGSKVKTLFLDTRNRRGFSTINSRPALLDDKAFTDQFKFPTAPKADETLFLISACPALGLSVFEELVYPLATSIKGLTKNKENTTSEARSFAAGQLAFDNEAWYLNNKAFEELLKQISVFKRAVLFSGDIHYGFTTVLDYWKKEETQPSRFIQLVSSPLKNLWKKNIRLFQSGFTQGIFSNMGGKIEKFGWSVPPSVSGVDMTLTNRRRLRESPAVIDNFGLQKTVKITPNAEWRYRLTIPIDERSDDKISNLPTEIHLKNTFDHTKTADIRIIAERFDHNFRLTRSRRVMFATHVCTLHFENDILKHTFLYRSAENLDTVLEMVHEVALTPSVQDQLRPEFVST